MILEKRPKQKEECTLLAYFKTPQGKNILLSLFFTGLFFLAIVLQYDFYYDLNDDTAMRDLLSGAHTGNPTGYNIQMLMPLSWILSLAYKILPQASCYGVFLWLCQFGAVFLIGLSMMQLVQKNIARVMLWIAVIGLFYSTMLYQFVFIQYSVTSGLLMAAAILWYAISKLCRREHMQWISIVCVILAFCIRTEICLMLTPFWLLVGFCIWCKEDNRWSLETMFSVGKVFLITLVIMFLALGINKVAYGNKDWKTFMNFFDERTTLYDFINVPTYDDNEAFYTSIGMTKSEWTLLDNYNFSIDSHINEDTLVQIITYRQKQANTGVNQPIYRYGSLYTTETIQNALWLYKQRLLENIDGAWYYILLATYLCLLMAGSVRKKSGIYAKVCLLFAGRSAIWLYLLVRNRTPERILVPLLLVEWIVLLSWMLQELTQLRQDKPGIQQWWTYGLTSLIAFVMIISLPTMQKRVTTEYGKRAEINQEWTALQNYCKSNPQNYYLLDVYSTVAYSEKMFAGVDNNLKNYDLCGGWIAKSPATAQKLANFQITDLQNDVINKDNIYIISKIDRDIDWLNDFYRDQGYSQQANRIDTISNGQQTDYFNVYQMQ